MKESLDANLYNRLLPTYLRVLTVPLSLCVCVCGCVAVWLERAETH